MLTVPAPHCVPFGGRAAGAGMGTEAPRQAH